MGLIILTTYEDSEPKNKSASKNKLPLQQREYWDVHIK